MKNRIITEIVEFKVFPNVSNESVIKNVDFIEINFHTKQKGFIDTELIKGKEEGNWIMIQHWKSLSEAKEASGKMTKSEFTKEFIKIIDKRSVKLQFLEQIQTWTE